jgi:hypothetical protein
MDERPTDVRQVLYRRVVLRLLHVSDIHFNTRWDGTPESMDVDAEVRGRMLQDFGRMTSELGTMDGILVVGDIANRGKSEEYRKAEAFLEQAAELIGCPKERVVCVPGNHDVDRSRQDITHDGLRSLVRAAQGASQGEKIAALLGDQAACESLMGPFEAYNAFALGFGCEFTADAPVMTPRTFPLAPWTLEVHGVNSAWIADGFEKINGGQLVAGLFQATGIRPKADTVVAVLMHHPTSWLGDGEELSSWLNVAHLVLTGHEHSADVTQAEGGKPVRIASGAVNPSRHEDGWIPAYNVIELIARPEEDEILVRVFARAWQVGKVADFGDAGRSEYAVPMAVVSSQAIQGHASAAVEAITEHEPEPEPVESAAQSHRHSIMRAAPDTRRREAISMGLLEEGEASGLEADRILLRRAADQDRLYELAARLVGGSEA